MNGTSPRDPGTVGALGERGLIRRLAARVGAPPRGCLGIGDDCALAPAPDSPWDLALTSDPLLEGRHFLPGDDPARVGHKAVGRVLSDLAAMGAEPLWILIDLVAPFDMPVARLEALYDGAAALCRPHGAAILGGDTSAGETLELHVFGAGRVPRGRAALRSGARPGDAIFVTGELGGSLLGRHLEFEPRLREGRWLREGEWVRAMIDLSDGAASDLRRIFESSGVGAAVERDRIPVSEAVRSAGGDPVERALRDGEDYELLFCVEPGRAERLQEQWPFPVACTRIGTILDEPGRLYLVDAAGVRTPYLRDGYEHFVETGSGG